MKTTQLAINTVSVSVTDLDAALASIAAAGFKKVEFQLGQVKTYIESGKTPEDARAVLEKHGLTCIGGFQAAVQCFGDDLEKDVAFHEENARLLSVLGGKTLVVGTTGPPEPLDGQAALDAIGKQIGVVAKRVAAHGVTLAIEFNWGPVVKTIPGAVEVCKRSGAPNVGVLFDPAHYHCTPTKMEHLSPENVAWIKHVHVDDMRPIPGEISQCNGDRELPGQGHLPLKEMFGRIETGGYDGDFSIEMFSDELWALPVEDAARKMYQSLLPLCEV